MTNLKQPPWRQLALIQQALLLSLLGGICLLLVELRFEHNAVLTEKWQSWIPLAYFSVMLILIPLGMIFLRKFGRPLLLVTFAGLACVGLLGFWFHSENKPIAKLSKIIATDLSAPGHLTPSDDQESPAPILAPLALVGLGAMGMLVCLWTPASETIRPEP